MSDATGVRPGKCVRCDEYCKCSNSTETCTDCIAYAVANGRYYKTDSKTCV